MDGRVLSVLLGPTGHPPKWYEIPVPAPDGPPTVLLYERVPSGYSKRLRLQKGWKYAFRPGAEKPKLNPRWPWSKPPRP